MNTHFDRLIDEFEAELQSGNSPRIERYLDGSPEGTRHRVLPELISLEVFYRTRQGQAIRVSEYARFGDVAVVHAEKALEKTGSTEDGFQTVDVTARQTRKKIGPYKLLEEIGEGGMGTVWLAEQEQPIKRRVALKLIKWEVASSEVLARFDAEKQALAMMQHPNIARVLNAGTTNDGHPYFVMELVKGVPITQYCDDNKLSIDERLKLFVPVCRALEHAHQKGILHRDIKPSNILVTLLDGEPIPKVIDFGLAKATRTNLKLTDKTLFTEFGRVVGTVQYMSPEQARMNALDVDTRSDIYSLGVTLYELLTGSTPIDKATVRTKSLLDVLEIVRETDPPRPSTRLSSLHGDVTSGISDLRRIRTSKLEQILQGELDWIVMKALEKDRTRRYPTAGELSADIQNYLTNDTVTARPPSAAYQVRKFASKNRGLVASLLTIGLLLLAGIAGTSYGLIQANRKAEEAETSQEIAEGKTKEAERERADAQASEHVAVSEKEKARRNEQRALAAEKRSRDAEAEAKFQLAVARWDANRAVEARGLLHEISEEYRDNFEWNLCDRRFQGSAITCYGHTGTNGFGGVYDVACSPDGKWIASASGDNTIKLWDPASGREIATLNGHEAGVTTLAISSDGTRIASGSFDQQIKLWDVQTRKEVLTLSGHSGTVQQVKFSPSGDTLASASDDKTVKLWDIGTGEVVRTFTEHKAALRGVAFHPDGLQIASVGRDRLIRIWNTESGEQIRKLGGYGLDIQGVAFSPDGTRLVVTTYNRISIWSTRTWKLVTQMEDHKRYVHCVAFSPDGSLFATGADDRTIRLWETKSGKLKATFCGHAKRVEGVAFTPDGSRLVSGSRDRTVKLWNLRGGNEIALDGNCGQLRAVAFSHDSKQLAFAAGDGTIVVSNAVTNVEVHRLKGHNSPVEGLAFSPDGTQLASGGYDNTIRIWDLRTGDEVAVLEGHTSWVRDVVFGPDGSLLASAGWDKTIKLWNVKTGKEEATLQGHRGGLYCLDISCDGQRLASASSDGTVKVWDTKTLEELQTLRHKQRVRAVAFGPKGERIASAGHETKVRIWDVTSGKQVATANAASGTIFGIAFSPDGKCVATADADRTVNVLNASTGKEIITLDAGTGGVAAVTFSPDGQRLAAAVHDGAVRIWATEPKGSSHVLTGHTDTVTLASFSADGSRIYAESGNEKLVWDTTTRERQEALDIERPQQHTQVSPDGRWFVTMESNNVVLINLEPNDSPR